MAVRSIVPLLTGGVVIVGALAVAYARRPARAHFIPGDDAARFAPEPVGPDEGMVEVLELASASNPVVKTEAEAMAGSGAGWPLVDPGPASANDATLRASLADLTGSADGFGDRLTRELEVANGTQTGFTEVHPGEAFLDLDIDLEDLETPTERGPTVVVSELALDDVASSRLERMDTLEDISETPTDPMASRESSERITERELAHRETVPNSADGRSRTS